MAGSQRDERAWVRGAQRGSDSDLESLFRHHWPRAYRAAYLVVHDAAAAEDIAQEAFLSAVRSLDRFDRRRPFGPWLHRIVVNRAIDWSRARALRREAGEAGLEHAAAAPAPDNPHVRTLASALAELSPEHRAVIVLRHLLVNTRDGAWIVSSDGSKRFLSNYAAAAWSPHGLYVAAARGNQLVALEPNGKVHWKLARSGLIHDPQWSYEGFRIAYFAGGALRVVNGDGTGDRLLTWNARPGLLAWEPATHSLAYVNRGGNIAVRNVDRPHSPAYIRTRLSPRRLECTHDGPLVALRLNA